MVKRHCRLKHSGDIRVVVGENTIQRQHHDDCETTEASYERKRYSCHACPYVSNSKSQFYYHKQFHRPRNAQFKCTKCSYNVTRRHLLHQHLKIHEKDDANDDDNDDDVRVPLVWIQFENEFVKMYKCRHCPETNATKSVIVEHEKSHGGDVKEFKCHECSFSTVDLDGLTMHSKYHNGVFGTVHCLVDEGKTDEEQITQLRKILSALKLNTSKGVLYFCPSCPARFLNKVEFNEHLKYHPGEGCNHCPCCDYTTEDPNALEGHLMVHTEEYQEKSKTLQGLYTISDGWKPPRMAVLMDVPEISGPAWIAVSGLQSHDSPKKYYRCDICPTKFYKPLALQYHKKLHGSKNPYRCKDCNYASRTPTGLAKHELDHNGVDSDPEIVYPKEKHYKCHKCPSAFEKREQLKTHLTLHGAQARYKCQECDYSVKFYANFIQHVKKHDVKGLSTTSGSDVEEEVIPGDAVPVADRQMELILQKRQQRRSQDSIEDRRYQCPKCPYTNLRRDSMDNHTKRHGATKANYACSYCDFSAPQSHFLRDHLKLHFAKSGARALELYMSCDKLKIWSQRVPTTDENDAITAEKTLVFDAENVDNIVDEEEEEEDASDGDDVENIV